MGKTLLILVKILLLIKDFKAKYLLKTVVKSIAKFTIDLITSFTFKTYNFRILKNP